MRAQLGFIISSLFSLLLARDVLSSASLGSSVINEKTALRSEQKIPADSLAPSLSIIKTVKPNNRIVRRQDSTISDGKVLKPRKEEEEEEREQEPEPYDEEERDKSDDFRGDFRKDVDIILKKPIQGQLKLINIPLNSVQKIMWEIPNGDHETTSISVTAVLQDSSGHFIVCEIAKKLPLSKTEAYWNTSDSSSKYTSQPLGPSNNWQLYIHDGATKFGVFKNTRLRSASVRFNLYIQPDVSNRFKAAGLTSSVPSSCGIIILSLLIFSIL